MGLYWHGNHTTHRLQVHLVWIPKYRKRVLRGKVSIRLKQLLNEACHMNQWKMHALNIQTDHVHALVQIKPSDSVSEVVQILKGGSSRVIRKEFPELEEFLWEIVFGRMGTLPTLLGR